MHVFIPWKRGLRKHVISLLQALMCRINYKLGINEHEEKYRLNILILIPANTLDTRTSCSCHLVPQHPHSPCVFLPTNNDWFLFFLINGKILLYIFNGFDHEFRINCTGRDSKTNHISLLLEEKHSRCPVFVNILFTFFNYSLTCLRTP